MADGKEIEPRGGEILVPVIGEIVPADDPAALAAALQTVRQAQAALRAAGEALTEAVVGIASVSGAKTLTLDDGTKLTVKGGSSTSYDAEGVENDLREAGMPETSIKEIVEETVTRTVKAVRLKQAAAANPVYREVMERHSTTVEKRPYVEVSSPPSRSRSPAKPPKGAES